MLILAIDTSCDETSAAVLDGGRVLSNVVWSQLKLHQKWGGVVPSLAKREHQKNLPKVVSAALSRAKTFRGSAVTAIAVTVGPGLPPALEVGVEFAKKYALKNNLPLIPVNHLEGHIASLFLKNRYGKYYVKDIESLNISTSNAHESPPLAKRSTRLILNLIVSGGHTELVLTSTKRQKKVFIPEYRLLGQTLDDAAGECLDKVGRELGLGYPAAPVIEQMAKNWEGSDPSQFSRRWKLPLPLESTPKSNLDFSFSGLKTSAIQQIHGTQDLSTIKQSSNLTMSKSEILDFCFTFQDAVINAILFKVRRVIKATGVNILLLSGGVAANNRFRRRLSLQLIKLGGKSYSAPKKFCGDNAAMIGLAAQWAADRGETLKTEKQINQLDRLPNLQFNFLDKPLTISKY